MIQNFNFTKYYQSVICGFVLFASGIVNAQSESLWHPVYEQFTVKDGLPGMEFYYSFQDSDGYMWFASDRGVVRYNGDKFETFTTDDGLVSNTVFKIDQDDKGRIWFLSDVPRLCYFENDRIKQYKFNDVYQNYYPENAVLKSYTAWNFDNDNVVISTWYGALKIDKNGTLTKLHKSLASEAKRSPMKVFFEEGLIMNGPQQIDGAFLKSILICHDDKEDIQIFEEGLSSLKADWIDNDRFFVAGNVKLYISTPHEDSLYQFDNRINSCTIIDDELWLGLTGGGVDVYDLEGCTLKKKVHLFKNLHVTNVFKTNGGHYWFTTIYNGLFVIKDRGISEMDAEDA